ncbi:hypothetical protein CPC08DRAFT_768691 [Agrocybe pediades]|nr:hypothetical protein CPC08DRAFT_768691 [Agrocybe pediades]
MSGRRRALAPPPARRRASPPPHEQKPPRGHRTPPLPTCVAPSTTVAGNKTHANNSADDDQHVTTTHPSSATAPPFPKTSECHRLPTACQQQNDAHRSAKTMTLGDDDDVQRRPMKSSRSAEGASHGPPTKPTQSHEPQLRTKEGCERVQVDNGTRAENVQNERADEQ